jgi:hypothetical protein
MSTMRKQYYRSVQSVHCSPKVLKAEEAAPLLYIDFLLVSNIGIKVLQDKK